MFLGLTHTWETQNSLPFIFFSRFIYFIGMANVTERRTYIEKNRPGPVIVFFFLISMVERQGERRLPTAGSHLQTLATAMAGQLLISPGMAGPSHSSCYCCLPGLHSGKLESEVSYGNQSMPMWAATHIVTVLLIFVTCSSTVDAPFYKRFNSAPLPTHFIFRIFNVSCPHGCEELYHHDFDLRARRS